MRNDDINYDHIYTHYSFQSSLSIISHTTSQREEENGFYIGTFQIFKKERTQSLEGSKLGLDGK